MTDDKSVLVTGASGFLGAWLTAGLIGDGRRVIACDLKPDSRLLDLIAPGIADGVDWRVCDVTNAEAVRVVLADARPSRIVHLAGALIPICRADPALGAMVNILGHINVVEAARAAGINHVIYTSSMAAKPRGPANAPANLYGVFKKTGEEVSRIQFADHGHASFGLRPHIVYGVGRDVGETAAVTLAMRAAALGEAYEIPYRSATCYQFAGDVVGIIRRLLETTWDGAFVSDLSSTVETMEDVVAAIQESVPEARITIGATERLSPVSGFETEPLERLIGPLPRTTLAEGARETIAQFRDLNARGGA